MCTLSWAFQIQMFRVSPTHWKSDHRICTIKTVIPKLQRVKSEWPQHLRRITLCNLINRVGRIPTNLHTWSRFVNMDIKIVSKMKTGSYIYPTATIWSVVNRLWEGDEDHIYMCFMHAPCNGWGHIWMLITPPCNCFHGAFGSLPDSPLHRGLHCQWCRSSGLRDSPLRRGRGREGDLTIHEQSAHYPAHYFRHTMLTYFTTLQATGNLDTVPEIWDLFVLALFNELNFNVML